MSLRVKGAFARAAFFWCRRPDCGVACDRSALQGDRFSGDADCGYFPISYLKFVGNWNGLAEI